KILQRRAVLHAGIVDEDVDGADLCLESIDRPARRLVVGGVEGERVLRAEVLRGGRQPGLVAAVEDDPGPGGGKPPGERMADPLRRAGDKGPLARQVEKL